ncbi:hypothetical protein [Halochromatium sp.]
MTETRYQLIFSGCLQSGVQLEQGRQAVKERFKLSNAQLDRLFSGRPVTVKRSLDRANAERYQRAFVAAGALVEVAPAAPPEADSLKLDDTASIESAPASQTPAPRANDAINASTLADPSDQETRTDATSKREDANATQLLPPGSPIGEQPTTPDAPPPDISHLQLAPSETTSLEDCAPSPETPPPLDLSTLELLSLDPSQQQE